jgi:hypothetical protein
MKRYWALAVLAILGATTSTQPAQCIRPAPTLTAPAGSIIYRTGYCDTPFELAKRFYGRGFLEYKIRDANRLLLLPNGTFPHNIDIVIPPDLEGKPVDPTTVANRPY